MKSTSLAVALTLATTLTTTAQVAPGVGGPSHAVEAFRLAHPQSDVMTCGDQIGRVYGNFSQGATPSDSAKKFIETNAQQLFGVEPTDLAPFGPFESGEHLVQIMPNRDVDGFKFTGVYYTQQFRGITVFRSNLMVLTRNEPGFPAVLASSSLWDVTGVEKQLDGVNLTKLPNAKLWTRNPLSAFRSEPEVGPAQYVIWAGIDRVKAEPRLAVLFTAEAGSPADPDNHQRIEFVVDAQNGTILFQENKIYHAVTGNVTGLATAGYSADTCASEVSTGLPHIEVKTGTTTVYADANGNFSIPAGAAGATYTTRLVGRYFTTTNDSAATVSLSTTANNGADWSPVFNAAEGRLTDVTIADANGNFTCAANTLQVNKPVTITGTISGTGSIFGYTSPKTYYIIATNGSTTFQLSAALGDTAIATTAGTPTGLQYTVAGELSQVNAYIMANKMRDLAVAASPAFPSVSTQTNLFKINCNLGSTCNAYYSGDTINFYTAGGGCAATSFGDIVGHEYGHNLVSKGGSGQGAYGEGMGDVCGFLMSDDPRLGVGFRTCTVGLRTAVNTCQFDAISCSTGSTSSGATCGSAIHSCGQLISGCCWDLRNRLAVTYPSTYRTELADLCINSILLHVNTSTIAADITIDFLTLDDNNANIADGTPNYSAINDSFTLHGLAGPPLVFLQFSFPQGLPSVIAPDGSTSIQVKIDPSAGVPNTATAKLYGKISGTSTYTQYPMTYLGSNLYQVNLPGGTCPSTLNFYVSAQSSTGVTSYSPATAPTAFYIGTLANGVTQVMADDFEAATTGWTVGATGDTATAGIWTRVDPLGTTAQPEDDHTPSPGVKAWITGQGTGGAVGAADVDGGTTTLVSPAYDCTGLTEAYVSYSRWYSNNAGASPNLDTMPVEISADNGATWIQLENVAENAGVWVDKTFRINNYVTPSAQVRLRFRAQDLGASSLVEAGVDDVRIYALSCTPPLIGDLDGNLRVNGADLGILLGAWGTLAYDLNGDGGPVAGGDLGVLLGNWTP
jgi:hypothetical protein